MSTALETTSLATCRLCPPDGGTVVATYSGDGPSRRAGDRAWEETRTTGVTHHDHYDPDLDAFVVIRPRG
ncbi:hypothetical protein ACEZCY_16825 [Streptacidiphilus sp. N1-12]|uniref:Uncharacterized protein n=2 Tax=Streptacidiphilus alkalitolerans TaxID=3342712 RepID=A0ABV6VAD4_9ACTN